MVVQMVLVQNFQEEVVQILIKSKLFLFCFFFLNEGRNEVDGGGSFFLEALFQCQRWFCLT